jgi:hypothetical protein
MRRGVSEPKTETSYSRDPDDARTTCYDVRLFGPARDFITRIPHDVAAGPFATGVKGVEITMKKALLFAVCLLVALSVRDAAAQTVREWTDRGYANVNIGFESGSGNLNDTATFRLYDEDGTLSVAQAVDSGAFFDFSVGARVWRNASAGIGFHTGTSHSEAAVQASVPDPVVFGRPRAVNTVVGDLKRNERAFHLQFGYMLPLSDRISVHVMAGPSFFTLNQDVVEALDVTETPSFGGTPVVARRTDSPVGANIGADVTYQFYERNNVKVGAGMFLRWTGASADVEVVRDSGHILDSDVGGLQIGFGGRVRF